MITDRPGERTFKPKKFGRGISVSVQTIAKDGSTDGDRPFCETCGAGILMAVTAVAMMRRYGRDAIPKRFVTGLQQAFTSSTEVPSTRTASERKRKSKRGNQ